MQPALFVGHVGYDQLTLANKDGSDQGSAVTLHCVGAVVNQVSPALTIQSVRTLADWCSGTPQFSLL